MRSIRPRNPRGWGPSSVTPPMVSPPSSGGTVPKVTSKRRGTKPVASAIVRRTLSRRSATISALAARGGDLAIRAEADARETVDPLPAGVGRRREPAVELGEAPAAPARALRADHVLSEARAQHERRRVADARAVVDAGAERRGEI